MNRRVNPDVEAKDEFDALATPSKHDDTLGGSMHGIEHGTASSMYAADDDAVDDRCEEHQAKVQDEVVGNIEDRADVDLDGVGAKAPKAPPRRGGKGGSGGDADDNAGGADDGGGAFKQTGLAALSTKLVKVDIFINFAQVFSQFKGFEELLFLLSTDIQNWGNQISY